MMSDDRFDALTEADFLKAKSDSIHKEWVQTVRTGIIASADELIQSGYANTNGLITREALRYRITGIIARHVLKDQSDDKP